MADNIPITAGSGPDVATDDISGVHYQKIKIAHGPNDSAALVTTGNGLPVSPGGPGTVDTFGRTPIVLPVNTIDLPFFRADDPAKLLTVTTADSATATSNVGGALFATGSGTSASVQAVSRNAVLYRSGSEMFFEFTASFTAGVASSHMRIGLFDSDSSDALFLGYEGSNFGITVRNNSVDSTVAKGSFSIDALTGAAGSLFTRAGTAEAIDLTKLNVYRIRFGWLGSAPVYWEVMAPDGHWVTFHETLFPNLQTTPSIRSADLFAKLDITKTTAGTTDLQIQTDCWAAGINTNNAQGILSAGNTRTTVLGSAATFTGIAELSEYPDVMVSCKTDVTGTLYFDFSNDGTNFDTFPTSGFTVASGIHEFHTALKGPRYFRARLVNDAGSPTYTRLYTYFGNFPKTPNAPLNQSIGDDSDASTTRAVLVGKNPGGSYVNIGSTTAGNLKMSISEASDGLDIGAGNAGGETIRVAVATDDVNLSAIKTAVELIDNTVATDASASPSAGQMVAGHDGANARRMAVDTSGNVKAVLQSNTGVDIGDVDVTSISAGSNLIGDVGLSGARTSGGTTIFRSIDLDETEEEVKATAGQVYWIHAMNLANAKRYLKFYNATAANVTVGTTTPVLTFALPTPGDTNGAGFTLAIPNGIAFSTAITVAATTGIADNDTGAPGANEVIINLGYA